MRSMWHPHPLPPCPSTSFRPSPPLATIPSLPCCLLLLSGLLHLLASTAAAHPHPGWKDETDWRKALDPGHPRRGPQLLPGLPSNISATAGRPATLPCRVANLKGRAVSWIRREDLKVLATNDIIFTTDQRFKVVAWRTGEVWAWDLQIEGVTPRDAGVYECQVNTRPKVSHTLVLHVHVGGATIAGPSEVYVESGSRLVLTCWVQAPPRPPGPLTWLHDGTPINAQADRGGVSLHEAQEGARASARLSLTSVTRPDAGNYTCQPEGLQPAHVAVFVLQDEEPQAMHHDGCPKGTPSATLTLLAAITTALVRCPR